ncbi:3-deoxy-manno-octulosonate cytidylyltransferase, partial [bacterium]
YASTRLPGKPLLEIAGRPLLHWVIERARRCGAADLVVATDDERIRASAVAAGADVQMTASDHASGTDRIAEVASKRGWPENDIVVNVQGDEPLMEPALVRQVADLLARHPDSHVATLCAPVSDLEAFFDPNVVKVVTDAEGRALYFSRAPVPWVRDGALAGAGSQRSFAGARRHIGLYAYRVAALARLARLPVSALENLEKLEQLRALENGLTIRVADAAIAPGPDVNTPADLARVAGMLAT